MKKEELKKEYRGIDGAFYALLDYICNECTPEEVACAAGVDKDSRQFCEYLVETKKWYKNFKTDNDGFTKKQAAVFGKELAELAATMKAICPRARGYSGSWHAPGLHPSENDAL